MPDNDVLQIRKLEQAAKIRRNITTGSLLTVPFLIMNGLATVVASYGLLANSVAVVIGAMIIAMLLGPIMGIALAMVDGDVGLLRKALTAEFAGAAMVVAIGALIGRIHFDLALTNEILSRTQPNLLDLGIAVAGGAAGAYATVSPRVSVGLVGVAISTALVPPLAACGICASRGLMAHALGAFLLFATNLVAIQCASSVVLYAFGFHKVTNRQEQGPAFMRRLVLDGVAFLGLSVFLYIQLAATAQQVRFERETRQRLTVALERIPGAYLSEIRYVPSDDKLIVVAVVRVPSSISPNQTEEIERTLIPWQRKPVELHVRSLLTKETTKAGYMHEIAPEAPPVDAEPQPTPPVEENSEAGSILLRGGI